MNITLDLPVKDEQQKEELKKYLIEKAKQFLGEKEDVLELIEADYDDMPEETKKIYDELFDEEGNVKDFNRFTNVENVS